MASPQLIGTDPVLFFDGECLFCNRTASLIAKLNSSGTLRFAPLQGETAKALLPTTTIEKLEAVVLYQNGNWVSGSDAVLASLKIAGGAAGVLARLLSLFPRFVREVIYRVVARNRRRIFGTCELPAAGNRRYLP